LEQLYAFYYQPSPPLYDQAGPGNIGPGWTIYNPREEFARMGVGSRTKAWRFTDINRDYQVGITSFELAVIYGLTVFLMAVLTYLSLEAGCAGQDLGRGVSVCCQISE
jgi:hypothetical protein